MSEIVIIAPDPEIIQLAEEQQLPDKQISVIPARLEEGVNAAQMAVNAGAKVLISRGVTFHMISGALPDTPVVEIQYTGYDMLRARLQADCLGQRPAVVADQSTAAGMASIEEILGLSSSIKIIFDDNTNISSAVTAAKTRGADTIIGTPAVIDVSLNLKLFGIVLHSGREAVEQATTLAFQLLSKKRLQEAATRQLDTIIDAIDYGVLAIDRTGAVTAINVEAIRLFNLAEDGRKGIEQCFMQKMRQCLLDRERKFGMVMRLRQDLEIVISFQPVIASGDAVGAVATFQPLDTLREIERRSRQELALRGRVARNSFLDIESQSTEMQKVIDQAKRFSGYDSTVLILGETGAGKEYFAQAIHQASPRKGGPFVAINCAAIPENILESELFGYTEGAFTGAKKGGKIGLFEQANHGTIFLDEIGEMSDSLQVRLLRVLQEHQVYRIGDDKVITVDIRVIAATNRNLRHMMAEKKFRDDLYYRLEVLTIKVPPLRERKADIPGFVRSFIADFNQKFHSSVHYIDPEGMRLLIEYDWPGNIRELHNFVERLVVLATSPIITNEEVWSCLEDRLQYPSHMLPEKLKSREAAAINEALIKTSGNKQEAAKLLGIGRSTLWRKLKELGN